eukprot:TRINITY_DN12875_c0_g1_i1.p1 TRINITY_DN12875_c0_g1~~TRINITY_DN12875_c0_g1_i1.p1  ORF type:complete len:197 (+),score=22.72 TRINITY_DN12875_c0_g1_i1:120-710(+)
MNFFCHLRSNFGQFLLYVVITIMDPVCFLLDPSGFVKTMRRTWLMREIKARGKHTVEEETRKRYFKLSEPRRFPLGERYSNVIVSIFGATALSTIFPVFYLVALVLRQTRAPRPVNPRLPVRVTEALEFLLLLNCLVQYLLLLCVYKPMATSDDREYQLNWSLFITHLALFISGFYLLFTWTEIAELSRQHHIRNG